MSRASAYQSSASGTDGMLSSPVQHIRGVGPRRAALLTRLGIASVRDILFYLPFRYEDRRSMKKIAHLEGGPATVSGKVVRTEVAMPRSPARRLSILEVTIADGSGFLKAKWFNQPYLKTQFSPGQDVVLYGCVKPAFGFPGKLFRGTAGFEMVNPEYELIEENDKDEHLHTGRIVPLYRTTEGLSQRQLRTIVHAVVTATTGAITDHLPSEIAAAHGLPSLRESLSHVHFPGAALSTDELNRGTSPFHQRLAFDELFILQMGLAAIKKGGAKRRGIAFSPSGRLANRLIATLPFRLTKAQGRVLSDILADMRTPIPMHRLLQGDVGSGKTIVALLAMLAAAECGYQAALMVPTEILAEQHYLNIHRLTEALGVKAQLLTGSRKHKDLEGIASGTAHIIIGTHALIQEGVSFRRLGLIVIDEQHRFGVLQRALLRKKGINPDTLIMTATPIPRTLALTLYGDLDYSVIDELPPNRSPVKTVHVAATRKQQIYPLIERETQEGRQVYVVYPLVEESEKTDLKAAVSGMEKLQAMFPRRTIGLLHGRMKPDVKEEVMDRFKRGYIDILVSTTVIEVGVDIPNATVMVIVHAERFGLAQLHQLRGRVGRGTSQSYCILLSYGATGDAKKRIDALVRTDDGFRIAEEDLGIRGPGEFFGTRQSGLPDLRAANLVRDVKLLETARKEAFSLIERDPALERYPYLKRAVEEFWGTRFELFKTA